jgi:hypothetical protein
MGKGPPPGKWRPAVRRTEVKNVIQKREEWATDGGPRNVRLYAFHKIISRSMMTVQVQLIDTRCTSKKGFHGLQDMGPIMSAFSF